MLLIVGPGGAGQTKFMEFLSLNGIKTNKANDSDGLKHLSSPSISKYRRNKEIYKVIYIYTSLYDSIKSLFRRRWTSLQCKKLKNPYLLTSNEMNNINLFSSLVKKHKKDVLGMHDQFLNWLNGDTYGKEVLFIHSGDIENNQQLICDFIGMDINFENYLEGSSKRKSKNIHFDEEVMEIYNNIDNDMRQHSTFIKSKNDL
tara:strand:+ start:40 stop:642 length:603 start_codon:yes stop_codon:yes gene_type:complete